MEKKVAWAPCKIIAMHRQPQGLETIKNVLKTKQDKEVY